MSWSSVSPTPAEVRADVPGDGVVSRADVVMDRGFTVAASPEDVWPWIVQLGKARAGWYLPRRVERLVPRGRRAIRVVAPTWQDLRVGDVIPDYGGRHATFEVLEVAAPRHLVYGSLRGTTRLSWSIHLTQHGSVTRVHLRLRLGRVRHRRLAKVVGGWFDGATIAGLASGLRERLAEQPRG